MSPPLYQVDDRSLGAGPFDPDHDFSRTEPHISIMLHKRILEWQAAHPNVTWLGWGVVWAIVLYLLLWPTPTH
jgi:hypothetical protein